MIFGLRCLSPARRPRPASLPVRVPAVEGLLRASFGFASRLRLAFRYGYRHRFRLAPFIQLDSAHAGHTTCGYQPRLFLPLKPRAARQARFILRCAGRRMSTRLDASPVVGFAHGSRGLVRTKPGMARSIGHIPPKKEGIHSPRSARSVPPGGPCGSRRFEPGITVGSAPCNPRNVPTTRSSSRLRSPGLPCGDLTKIQPGRNRKQRAASGSPESRDS